MERLYVTADLTRDASISSVACGPIKQKRFKSSKVSLILGKHESLSLSKAILFLPFFSMKPRKQLKSFMQLHKTEKTPW